MRVGVIIPYRKGCPWRDRALPVVKGWWETICPDWPVTLVDDGGTPFSRGSSLNLGIKYAGLDTIIAADGDILAGRRWAREAVELAQDGGLVQPFSRLDWHSATTTDLLLTAPHLAFEPRGPKPLYSWPADGATPLLGGINVLTRETWETAGGWLPAFRGWGHEDIAFACQVETMTGHPVRYVDGVVAHLFHPPRHGTAYDRDGENVQRSAQVLAARGDTAAMAEVIRCGSTI